MTQSTPKALDKQALKELLSPPAVSLELPPVQLHLAGDEHPLHARLQKNESPDSYVRYQLALRAEPLRQESRMHRFLSPATRSLPTGAGYLLDAMRKAIRHCHGRSLLAHEPGLGATLGLSMLLQEYLLRGLVHRSLVLVPREQLGYWAARLNAGLDEPFVTCATMPPTDAPLPDRLLLSADLFEEELPPHMAQEGFFQMIAVVEAQGLRRRRSRPWRNLLSLSPKHMLLQSLLPFEEKPVELHGYLALLGVPELPPAARLKRELGPPEGPITPETRQILRPFLDASVLRNTHPTTPIAWAPRQWKTIEVPLHAPTQRLRKQVLGWLKAQQPAATEETPTPTHLHTPLLEAAYASAAATVEVLGQMAEDETLAAHEETFATWQDDAEKVAPHDPRLSALRSLLRESPNSRVLIFAQHEATARTIHEMLQEFEDRPIASCLDESLPEAAHNANNPAIMLATDQNIPATLTGPLDIVVMYDLPWNAVRLDARAHWLLHQQGDQTRQIVNFVSAENHDAQLLEALDFRLKLEELFPEELPLIARQFAAGEGLEAALWSLIDSSTTPVIEVLSKQLLNARKQYRRLRDLNGRLFLDDFAL